MSKKDSKNAKHAKDGKAEKATKAPGMTAREKYEAEQLSFSEAAKLKKNQQIMAYNDDLDRWIKATFVRSSDKRLYCIMANNAWFIDKARYDERPVVALKEIASPKVSEAKMRKHFTRFPDDAKDKIVIELYGDIIEKMGSHKEPKEHKDDKAKGKVKKAKKSAEDMAPIKSESRPILVPKSF